MKKKLFSVIMCVLMVMCFMPSMAFAGSVTDCNGGDACTHEAAITVTTDGVTTTTHYDKLSEAVTAAGKSGGEITILRDLEQVPRITIPTKNPVIINLNGKNISFAEGKYFYLSTSSLELKGEGKISSTGKQNTPIYILGGMVTAKKTNVAIGEGVTLEGWAPIFVANGGSYKNKNVTVQVNGKLSAIDDSSNNKGAGVYVHGKITTINDTNGINISLGSASSITSTGAGIYAAGYANWNLAGDIDALHALSIKSGTFNITGGTYTSTGTFADPADANNNGSEPTGAAISITSNDSYAKKIDLTVTGGTFTSTNGYALYEGIANNNGTQAAASSYATLNIQGGTFNGKADKEAVNISTAAEKKVLTGGTFNSNPTSYVAENYAAVGNTDGNWTVKEKTDDVQVDTSTPGTTKVTDTSVEGQTTVTETTANKTTTTTTKTGTDEATGKTQTTETKLEITTNASNEKVETKTEKVTTGEETSTEETKTTTQSDGKKVVETTKTVKDAENNVDVTTTVNSATGTAQTTAAIEENKTTTTSTVEIDATAAKVDKDEVKTTVVTLPAATATALNTAAKTSDETKKVEIVELKTDVATLEIDNKALKTLTENASGNDLVLTVAKTDSTVTNPGSTTEQTSTVTATYELTATINGNDAFTSANSATNGNITVNVHYEQKANNKAVKVYYVDANGAKTDMNASYSNNVLTWRTNHFSTFQVEETEPVKYGGSSSSKSSSTVDKTEDTTKDTGDAGDTGVVEEKDTKAEVAKLVKALSIKARSSKTKKGNIKVTLTVDADEIQAIEDLGYTVKYKFYRSTKKASSYKAKIEGKGKTYTNTSGKKGTKYYYKARVMVYDTEGTLIAKTALKQCKYACRIK